MNVLSYNLSWATQINLAAGSEIDFVKACQKKYKTSTQCTKNAFAGIKKLRPLDLAGFQEVNSDIEHEIQKIQPSLDQFFRCKVGLSTVSLCWNSRKLGLPVYTFCTNLSIEKNDDRPCLIVVFKNIIAIVVHAPHYPKDANISLAKAIQSGTNRDPVVKKFMRTRKQIIMMGDFNDHKIDIHKDKPIQLSKKIYSPYTRNQLRKKLTTCCLYTPWESPGDYILASKGLSIKNLRTPPHFRKVLASNHYPVTATVDFVRTGKRLKSRKKRKKKR